VQALLSPEHASTLLCDNPATPQHKIYWIEVDKTHNITPHQNTIAHYTPNTIQVRLRGNVVIHCISPESIPRVNGITRIDWKSIQGLDVVYKPSSFLSQEYKQSSSDLQQCEAGADQEQSRCIGNDSLHTLYEESS
jgi:hypothetical protein